MFQYKRHKTREITIGNVKIGGDNPILIQSMTNTKTSDVAATVNQILQLEEAGCEIIRVTVNDQGAADAIEEIKKQIHIPLVADIHFNYRLALSALENGIDKLRLNPGNIGSEERIKAVVESAKRHSVPIRIGVNSGSLEQEFIDLYGGVTTKGLVESAMKHVRILERYDFEDIVISLKASNIMRCVESYNMLASKVDYPLHIGITEAGTLYSGTIKSSAGIGILLAQGFGDTLRVSLTGDPVEEVRCAKQLLQAMGLRTFGVELISCPTCGRTEIDLIELANEVEERLVRINKNIKVAIMGCVVNGPGEAREADIGIAAGKDVGLIFKKGEIIKKVPENQLLDELMTIIETL
ncbi:flavodoxin-dependent (E)-4-hydroxy-3-methylbut-2-enyl-diphosphate synthase [Vallitalea okinawensis]|uniref:flavodoxin-dependent (E)-4-hydroxy-3-methylbut-2-enyl-diphosphate synthase n=1 Tax=Vallitalea okinawensis TaxID=2078660 RepID=UPI000CFE3313|nr:flavodoxin-dependent (E)-4-hydroxy-3-methylbut-2-enyl-diphosphate synthase [Vallitalea okinawensis]